MMKQNDKMKTFYLRNIRGGENYLPIKCRAEGTTAFDLVTLLIKQASLFSLRGDELRADTLYLYRSHEGCQTRIELDMPVADFDDNQKLQFDPDPNKGGMC